MTILKINQNKMEKEIKIYVINIYDIEEVKEIRSLTDEEFQTVAEELGTVYSLKGFEKAFNNFEINTETDFIKIM